MRKIRHTWTDFTIVKDEQHKEIYRKLEELIRGYHEMCKEMGILKSENKDKN